ncbi:hypothetical protein VF14_27305, partial [Nostoc linckia z18]
MLGGGWVKLKGKRGKDKGLPSKKIFHRRLLTVDSQQSTTRTGIIYFLKFPKKPKSTVTTFD